MVVMVRVRVRFMGLPVRVRFTILALWTSLDHAQIFLKILAFLDQFS